MVNFDRIKTDFHTHFLPKTDDGANSTDISVSMLRMLKSQGINKVLATPHYYNKEDKENFLLRRNNAYKSISAAIKGADFPEVKLCAEVNMFKYMSETDLSCFCIENTKIILLEIPYGRMNSWVINELESIIYEQKLTVILAHLDRYLQWFGDNDFKNLLSLTDIVYQINAEAFSKHKSRKFVYSLASAGYPLVFGSDCHNLTTRPPDFGNVNKYLNKNKYKIILKNLDHGINILNNEGCEQFFE